MPVIRLVRLRVELGTRSLTEAVRVIGDAKVARPKDVMGMLADSSRGDDWVEAPADETSHSRSDGDLACKAEGVQKKVSTGA